MPISKSWFVYIVRCVDNSLYTGITTNLNRRVKEHQDQGPKTAKYIRGKAPVNLVYNEVSENRSSASVREAELKKMSKRQKEDLIKNAQ